MRLVGAPGVERLPGRRRPPARPVQAP